MFPAPLLFSSNLGACSAVEVAKNHNRERMEDHADWARMRTRDYAKPSFGAEGEPTLLLGPPF